MAHDEVNEETVYTCTGQPLPNDIAKIVEWILNEDFSTAYHSTQCSALTHGPRLHDIVEHLCCFCF